MLEVGRAARELLQHPAFLTSMQSQEALHITAMVHAPEGPQGQEARDHHHRMLCALRDLAGDLAGRAQAAAEIEARAREAADDEEDDIE